MKDCLAVLISLFTVVSVFAQQAPAVPSDDAPIAMVLGRTITGKERSQLNRVVFGMLIKKYTKENNIKTSQKEINAFIKKSREKKEQIAAETESFRKRLIFELNSDKLTEKDRSAKTEMLKKIERNNKLKAQSEKSLNARSIEESSRIDRKLAGDILIKWKINKALFNKYGGRVIFQRSGPEPVDAYRQFLEDEMAKGSFRIYDKKAQDAFWRYFRDDSMHTFYSEKEGKKAMSASW